MGKTSILRSFVDENFSNYLLMLVGDAAVGKTSILRGFVDENFSSTYASTIGRQPIRYETLL